MKTRNFKNFAINVFAVVTMLTGSQMLMADDNEVLLDQSGNTLTFTVIQQGDSNKVAGNAASSSDLILRGGGMKIDIAQIGSNNEIFGAWTGDGSGSTVWDMYFYGNSNSLDMNIGASGSADSVDMLWNIQGDTNIFDVDIGKNFASDNLNMDLTILGDRNDFRSAVANSRTWGGTPGSGWNGTTAFSQSGVNVDAGSATWEMNITGCLLYTSPSPRDRG